MTKTAVHAQAVFKYLSWEFNTVFNLDVDLDPGNTIIVTLARPRLLNLDHLALVVRRVANAI